MTSSKPIKTRAAMAGRIDALTQAWKKAFDTRIRDAALTRRLPPGKAASAAAKDRSEIKRRARPAAPCAGPTKRPCDYG